jgi:hypothetical protein
LAKYDRVSADKKMEIIKMYRAGYSMARVGRAFAVSSTEVSILVHEAQKGGNPVLECHWISVALGKGGIDINQYLDLIRAEKVMARHGINPDVMLSQVKKFADVCYIKNIDIEEFASLFNRFREFLLSAPKGEHPDTINLWINLFPDLCYKIDAMLNTILCLREQNQRLRIELGQGVNLK